MSRTYVIYKIKSLDSTIDYCYVGSTQNFIKRKWNHKSRCNTMHKKSDNKLYHTMRENGGWDNFEMTPIEEYKCDTPQQAHIREQYWIENIEEGKLNSINAFISAEDRLAQAVEYIKEYRFKNRDKIAEQYKEYYFKNRDQMAKKNEEYYFKNRDQIQEQKKEYYFKNRDKAQRNYIWKKISKEFLSILLNE